MRKLLFVLALLLPLGVFGQTAGGIMESQVRGFKGTWTPIDASGAALSLTTSASTYIKIGSMMFASFSITYPVTADGTTMKLGGLPCTAEAVGANVMPVSIAYTETTSAAYGRVLNNTTTFQVADAAGTTPTNATMSAKLLRGMAIYNSQC